MRVAVQYTTAIKTATTWKRPPELVPRMAFKLLIVLWMDGAESRTRTDDLLITNQLLYQLSYFGLLSDCIVRPVEGKVASKKLSAQSVFCIIQGRIDQDGTGI